MATGRRGAPPWSPNHRGRPRSPGRTQQCAATAIQGGWRSPRTPASQRDNARPNTPTNSVTSFTYEARYQDIVPDQRIVYSYDMHLDDRRISVSLGTVEIEPTDGGSRLRYTEQGVFLDGLDTPQAREQGTRELLDALASVLERASSPV